MLPLTTFIRSHQPDALLLMFLGDMYSHHPMMTFLPSLARYISPTTRVVTQFEHLGVRTRRSFGTKLVRRVILQWAGREGADWEYGTLLRDSDHIVTLSSMHTDALAQSLPSIVEKHSLIPPPPNVKICPPDAEARSESRRSLGIRADEFVLVFYGLVFPGKGIEYLLKALVTLRARGIHPRLLIVGGAIEHARGATTDKSDASQRYLRAMRELTGKLDLGQSVHWVGHCPPETDAGSLWIRASDACILPFAYGIHLNNSSFASVAVHGLPIIATKVATTESQFRHRENVYLIQPESDGAIADAIAEIMKDDELRRTLERGIRQMSADWFSVERAADRTIATLDPRVVSISSRPLEPTRSEVGSR
jgi:glycosyltransferase involved in cell wall biosynthesis